MICSERKFFQIDLHPKYIPEVAAIETNNRAIKRQTLKTLNDKQIICYSLRRIQKKLLFFFQKENPINAIFCYERRKNTKMSIILLQNIVAIEWKSTPN